MTTMEECVEAMVVGAKSASLDPSSFVTAGQRVYWRRLIEAALAAAEASGFVLVPKEATEEMTALLLSVSLSPDDGPRYIRRSFDGETTRFHFSRAQLASIWSAMVSAASPGAKGK